MLGAIAFRRDLFAEVEAKPDLYGPFWIATSVVFLMAMISNGLEWLAHRRAGDAWAGDPEKVVYGAAVLYGYVFGAGLALWAWLKVINLASISLPALWCLFGARAPALRAAAAPCCSLVAGVPALAPGPFLCGASRCIARSRSWHSCGAGHGTRARCMHAAPAGDAHMLLCAASRVRAPQAVMHARMAGARRAQRLA